MCRYSLILVYDATLIAIRCAIIFCAFWPAGKVDKVIEFHYRYSWFNLGQLAVLYYSIP